MEMDTPRIIRRAGWVHQKGRFAGYCMDAKYFELGERAAEAVESERLGRKNLTALLNRRVQLGLARRAMDPKISLIDWFAHGHERKAAGVFGY